MPQITTYARFCAPAIDLEQELPAMLTILDITVPLTLAEYPRVQFKGRTNVDVHNYAIRCNDLCKRFRKLVETMTNNRVTISYGITLSCDLDWYFAMSQATEDFVYNNCDNADEELDKAFREMESALDAMLRYFGIVPEIVVGYYIWNTVNAPRDLNLDVIGTDAFSESD